MPKFAGLGHLCPSAIRIFTIKDNTVEFEKKEANEKKDKQLKEYRRKAELKGFRKGMAPMGLIERLYGPTAMNEAVNELITDGINGFIKDNNLDLIGEPIPNEEL